MVRFAAIAMPERTLFEELGGEQRLRAIVDRFVDRNFDDDMIGFFFRNASRERIKQMEYEFAARHLGADIAYSGRDIDKAHARHPIMGGQFMRRLQILRETLDEFAVPERVKQHWLEHTLSLQPLVTRDADGRCDPASASAKVEDWRNGQDNERSGARRTEEKER
jgi:hemoglobin